MEHPSDVMAWDDRLADPDGPEMSAAQPAITGRVRVLIVDDNKETLFVLRTTLEELDAEIVCVPTGQEALSQLLTSSFAAVLLDLGLPDMDGFEVATLLRDRAATRDTPVLFLTGYGDRSFVARAYQLGAVDFLEKPVMPEVLRSKVRVLTQLARQAEEIRVLNHDLQRQVERRTATLAEREAELKQVLDNVPALICRIDREQVYRRVNRAHQEWLGLTEEQIVGRTLREVLGEPHCSHAQPFVMQVLEGERVTYESCAYMRDGQLRDLSLTYMPDRAADGSVQGFIALAHDITERREHERELQVAKEAAEAANQAKSQFLAGMSHELRTPLNAILGYSELLREQVEELDIPVLVPDLQKIYTAGKHLLGLINDVLDLSKIEAGRMDVCPEEFTTGALLREVTDTIQPLADRNHNRLELALQNDLGKMSTDLTKVRQSLLNLLSNACKFTKRGQITLGAERYEHEGLPWIRFWVQDTGIGIAPAKIGRLFELFSQAEASTSRVYGGTGLGLALTRRLCRLMGGDVSVESVSGQGSTFTIALPAVLPVDRPAEEPAAAAATTSTAEER